jgi:hypothetical protein
VSGKRTLKYDRTWRHQCIACGGGRLGWPCSKCTAPTPIHPSRPRHAHSPIRPLAHSPTHKPTHSSLAHTPTPTNAFPHIQHPPPTHQQYTPPTHRLRTHPTHTPRTHPTHTSHAHIPRTHYTHPFHASHAHLRAYILHAHPPSHRARPLHAPTWETFSSWHLSACVSVSETYIMAFARDAIFLACAHPHALVHVICVLTFNSRLQHPRLRPNIHTLPQEHFVLATRSVCAGASGPPTDRQLGR